MTPTDPDVAHATMIKEAALARGCLIRLLNESSRDAKVLREFLEQYISYRSAADILLGRTRP